MSASSSWPLARRGDHGRVSLIEEHEDAVGVEHGEKGVPIAAVDGPRVLVAERPEREPIGDLANVGVVGHEVLRFASGARTYAR